jgi:hypothetical protein
MSNYRNSSEYSTVHMLKLAKSDNFQANQLADFQELHCQLLPNS